MNNKMFLESPTRKRLKSTIIVFLMVFALTMLFVVIFSHYNKIYFNGMTAEISGTAQELLYDEEMMELKVQFEDKTVFFDTSALFEEIDWNTLRRQTVTFWIPQYTQSQNKYVLLGVATDTVIIDAQTTINLNHEEGKTITAIFAAVSIFSAIAACACTIWRINIGATKEYSLAEVYAKFFANYFVKFQPRKNKKHALLLLILLPLFAIVAILSAIFAETISGKFLFVFLGAIVAMFALILICRHLTKKNLAQHFAQNYPYGFNNTQQTTSAQNDCENDNEIIVVNYYPDGGNDCDIVFEEKGITLTFNDCTTAVEAKYTNHASNQHDENVYIPYEELNFEALHFHFAQAPIVVVIKSRLSDLSALHLDNDIHLILDADLLHTINSMNIPVENLDFVLANKQQLIDENLFKRKH